MCVCSIYDTLTCAYIINKTIFNVYQLTHANNVKSNTHVTDSAHIMLCVCVCVCV